MHRTALWQHSSNSNIKIVHNSIDHFLWNLSDFSSDDVLTCLGIAFTNSVFQLPPSENSQAGWDLGKRMARGYRFDVKWVGPMGSYAWSIQVFCSRKEVPPHFSNRTLEYLTRNFPWNRLVLHQTDNPWPSSSQDLNLPDYFLRGVPERQRFWKQSTEKRGHHQKRNQMDSTRNARWNCEQF